VGDHYGLIDYSERHMGNSMEYSICRSQRLVDFAESQLVTGVNDIIGMEISISKPACESGKRTASRKNGAGKASKSSSAKTKAASRSGAVK